MFRWIDGFPVGTDLTLVQSLTVPSSSGRIVVAHINFSKSGVQVDWWFLMWYWANTSSELDCYLRATDIWWFPILTSKSLVFRWINGFSYGTDLTLVQSWTASSRNGRTVVSHFNFKKSGVQVDWWFPGWYWSNTSSEFDCFFQQRMYSGLPILTSQSLLFRWIDGFSCGTELTPVQSWTATCGPRTYGGSPY